LAVSGEYNQSKNGNRSWKKFVWCNLRVRPNSRTLGTPSITVVVFMPVNYGKWESAIGE
jgi:hypothetical protein